MHDHGPLNILISYAYINKFNLKQLYEWVENGSIRILLDCGAFTVYNNPKASPIDLNTYCSWVKKHEDLFWGYFQLDVMFNATATLNNYLYMKDRGLTPIPIFTRGAKKEHLKTFINLTDLVAFGGLITLRVDNYIKKAIKLFHKLNKKIHVLGFGRINDLKTLKPYSVDSSSWSSGMPYGTHQCWDHVKQCLTTFSKNEPLTLKQIQFIKSIGFDPTNLKYRQKNGIAPNHAIYVSIYSWLITMYFLQNYNVLLWLAQPRFDLFKLIVEVHNELRYKKISFLRGTPPLSL